MNRKLLATAIVMTSVAVSLPARAGIPPIPVPQDPRLEHPAFLGAGAAPQPLASFPVPEHPAMAPNGRSNLHNDAYMTDAYDVAGPLGPDIEVGSTFHVADCASVTFDSQGRIVTICVGIESPRLVLLDPETLELLAYHPLPPRFPTPGTGTSIFNDFSGGGYFYLDEQDRAIIPTNSRQIWVVGLLDTPAGPTFVLETVHTLSVDLSPGEAIVSALPDWDGLIWFAGSQGTVGLIDRGGDVHIRRLAGEVIANSFAVDETGGVYIASDHALYRFDADSYDDPAITWAQAYDRGTRIKPGQVSQGTGTTPTLLGEDYVAITDNAEPRINVVVYRRNRTVTGSRLVCSEPVFADGLSATENTLVGFGHSVIVENNYGYTGPLATDNGASTEPGITRVDFVPETGTCSTVWESSERSPTLVPKVSLATGLLYVYTKTPAADGTDPWYLTAIDARTGETVWKRLAGDGLGYNNNYAPVSLGPDGTAYVGVLGGLLRFADI